MSPEPRARQHLQRVPPHDLATEAALLGAALLDSRAAAIVAELGPDLYYGGGTNTLVAEAISSLVAEEAPTDVGTVVARLRELGQLDAAGGPGAVAELQFACSAVTSAPKWAEMLVRYARRRRLLQLAGDVANATYANVDTAGLVSEMAAASEAIAMEATSSWEPVNILAVLAGEGGEIRPAHMIRSDGVPLLYPGKVHAFQGEPESAKSFMAQWVAVERLEAGEHVLYVDFEAAAADVVERLVALGATPAALAERFHYVHPAEALDAGARLKVAAMLATWPIAYAVIDGVAEALSMNNWSENDATDVTKFFVFLPRVIARKGATVVVIDHLAKDKDRQGQYARGSGAKLAAIDGAAFKVEVVPGHSFARGATGRARVTVVKDRHGWVRASAAGGRIGEFTMSSHDGELCATLGADTSTSADAFRPTALMERVSRVLEEAAEPLTQRGVLDATTGKRDARIQAIRMLVAEGYVASQKHGSGERSPVLYTSVRPFRETIPEPAGGVPDDNEMF